jgi:hypothetical protein
MNAHAFLQYEAMLTQIRDQLEQEARDNSISRIEALDQVVREADGDIPGVLPNFDKDAMRGRWHPAFGRYDMSLLRAWFAVALSRLQVPPQTIPQTPSAGSLTFVSDMKLREILEADLAELRGAYAAGCLKSTIILCGAAIEALLVDALSRHTANQANTPSYATLLEWGLAKLIDKAIEYNLIRAAAAKFSHSVREYRNLVHPGRVVREGLAINVEEARIAIEILNIVCRDLSALATTGRVP